MISRLPKNDTKIPKNETNNSPTNANTKLKNVYVPKEDDEDSPTIILFVIMVLVVIGLCFILT